MVKLTSKGVTSTWLFLLCEIMHTYLVWSAAFVMTQFFQFEKLVTLVLSPRNFLTSHVRILTVRLQRFSTGEW